MFYFFSRLHDFMNMLPKSFCGPNSFTAFKSNPYDSCWVVCSCCQCCQSPTHTSTVLMWQISCGFPQRKVSGDWFAQGKKSVFFPVKSYVSAGRWNPNLVSFNHTSFVFFCHCFHRCGKLLNDDLCYF